VTPLPWGHRPFFVSQDDHRLPALTQPASSAGAGGLTRSAYGNTCAPRLALSVSLLASLLIAANAHAMTVVALTLLLRCDGSCGFVDRFSTFMGVLRHFFMRREGPVHIRRIKVPSRLPIPLGAAKSTVIAEQGQPSPQFRWH
jgi:hypothetical protein